MKPHPHRTSLIEEFQSRPPASAKEAAFRIKKLTGIERLWKFVKKKCLYNVYYETFEDFVEGINDCLKRVETEYKNELATLIKPNFQNLKKGRLLAV